MTKLRGLLGTVNSEEKDEPLAHFLGCQHGSNMLSNIVHHIKPCNVCDVLRLEIRFLMFLYLRILRPAVTVGIPALMSSLPSRAILHPCHPFARGSFHTGAGQVLRLKQTVREAFLL